MAPEERFLPRFAAEPPQEGSLRTLGGAAAGGVPGGASSGWRDAPEDLGEIEGIAWYPGSHLARAHIRARDRHDQRGI